MKRTTSSATAAIIALAVGLTACSSSKSSSTSTTSAGSGAAAGSVTVGSADFAESELLADIYADALSATFFPEYSGSILAYLDHTATAKSPADVAAALPAALGSSLTALTYAAAQDSDTITVTKATADKYHLTSIADLAAVANKLTLGAPAAFQTRPDGVPALKSVYGVMFKTFTPTSAGGSVTLTALKNGSIDAADIFSTDPAIAANNLVSLTDPKSMFAAQNIVPIIANSALTQTIRDAANAVSAKLDTATLAALVAKVQNDGQKPDDVAKAWLAQEGLG